MGSSRRPGVLGLPFPGCLVASRTPGILGWLDQSDPGVTALLGDTSGIIGFGDGADPTLPPRSHLLERRVRGCGSPQVGPISTLPPARIELDNAQAMALEITTYFESGVSMNYQALAGDFDGQGMSFGLIQWNFGQNTLGPLLNKMLTRDAKAFAGCFGKDAQYETLRSALARSDQGAQLTWARTIQRTHRQAWMAVFKALGSVDAFNRIQRQEASANYHPLVVRCICQLRGIRSDLMRAVEFRAYAALFDLCVQQNGLDKALHSIKSRVKHEKPTTQLELLKIAVVQRGLAASKDWAADCISRRMGILNGGSCPAAEYGRAAERANPQFDLITKYGAHPVAGI